MSSILKGSRARTACAAPALMMTDCPGRSTCCTPSMVISPRPSEAEDEGISWGGVARHALVGVDGEERDLATGLLGQGEAGDLALLDAQLVGQGEGGGVGEVLDELGHG